jgi:chromosome segregation ATPase
MFSISELSRTLNVSTQSLYKKINKSMKDELKPYIQTINGQIFIDERGAEVIKNSLQPLSVVDNENKQNVVNQDNNDIENSSNHADNSVVNQNLTDMIDFYKKQCETLQDELQSEREQIKDLQSELKTEREHSRDITRTLAELTHNSQELTRNSQLLLKQEQDKSTLLLSDERPHEIPTEKKDSRGFFHKLFKGKKKNDSQ